jgi:drug/metabolite transporter (DMT)-like permease
MTPPAWLWALFTIAASGAQTARNAMQRDLIATLGTAGATFVRFVYGLPFALVFLGVAALLAGETPPLPGGASLAWAAAGGLAQILATGLLLATMKTRSFVVATAYTKTEPVQVALFGTIFLGDRLGATSWLAIAVATAGVTLMSWPKGEARDGRAALLGLSAAALFAVSAVGYRAAIVALGAPSFIIGASTILALTLSLQSALILVGLALFDRPLLRGLAAAWKPSLGAGFMGALASQFWFLAFAIESAARVRTLALIEIPFAQIASRRVFRQTTSAREWLGMALIVGGVALLLLG